MVKKRVIVLVLILELVGVFGFYINKKPKETEVYEVKEDQTKHSLTITYPKSEKPTLREIIYYHIIETPYGQNHVINEHIYKNDSAIEYGTGSDSIDSEHGTGSNPIESKYETGGELIEKEHGYDTSNNSTDQESNTASDSINNESDTGSDPIENEHNTGSHSIDNERNTGNNSTGNERKTGSDLIDSKSDSGSDPIEKEHATGSDSTVYKHDFDSVNSTEYDHKTDNNSNENKRGIGHDLTITDHVNANTNTKNITKNARNEQDISSNENSKADKNVAPNEKKFDGQVNNVDFENTNDTTRYFTNGHGFQQFNTDPETQDDLQKEEISSLEESLSKIQRNKRSLINDGKTYGMSLTGGTGVVWNDFNDVRVAYAGDEIREKKEANSDDQEINAKIDSFKKEMGKEMKIKKTSTEKPDIKILNTEAPITEIPSTKKPNIVVPNTKKPSMAAQNTKNVESTMKQSRTYGMSLTGDHGVVWNDLNDHRVAYRVGDSIGENEENDDPVYKENKDNKEIDANIEHFEKELEKSLSEEAKIKQIAPEKPSTEQPSTEKPITGEPITNKPTDKPRIEKPKAQEPITNEPTAEKITNTESNKPVKTYGMSLSGDHGLVWNDLNEQPVSYHVGETEENKDDTYAHEILETPDIPNLDDIHTVPDNNKPDSTPENKPWSLDDEIDLIFGPEKETSKPENNTNNSILSEMVDIVKGVFEKEMAKLEEKIKNCNNQDKNKADSTTEHKPWNIDDAYKEIDEIFDPPKETNKPEIDTNSSLLNEIVDIIKGVFEKEMAKLEEKINNCNPDENNKVNTTPEHKPWNIDDAYKEIDEIFGPAKETSKAEDNTNKSILNEMVDIIKELFKDEMAKLEEKINNCNNPDKNKVNSNPEHKPWNIDDAYKEIDKIFGPENNTNEGDNGKTPPFPEDFQNVIRNEQFWEWLNEWTTTYTELLMNRIDTRIKKEVAKQIEEYFATHEHVTEPAIIDSDDNYVLDPRKDLVSVDENESSTKKRKDKDNEKKKEEKEAPVKIEAQNVYGSSVGNGNVTNIFVFNIRNISDIENIKELSNGSNGIFLFGQNGKPTTDNDGTTSQENKDSSAGPTTQNPNNFLGTNIPYDLETKGTTEKAITKPIENTPDDTSKTPEETESTTKQPKPEETTEQGTKDKLDGQEGGSQTPTTDYPSDSSSNNPEDHEINLTTEKATLKPVIVEEKAPEETTENPKAVESSSEHPGNDKSKDEAKDNEVSYENDYKTTEKVNNSSTKLPNSTEDNLKDTTTEETTSKPNSAEHKPDQTTETPKETESTINPTKTEDATEQGTKDNGQEGSSKDSTIEHPTDFSSNNPEDHEINLTTEKATLKPVTIEEKTPEEMTENPKETVEFSSKLPEADSKEKNDENDVSNDHDGNTTEKVKDSSTELPDSKEDKIKDTTTEKSKSEEHNPDQTTETPKESAESSLPEKDSKENDETENQNTDDADESKTEDISVNSKETEYKEPNKASEDKETDKNSEEANSAEETKDTAEKKNEKEQEGTEINGDKPEDIKTSEEKLDTSDKESKENSENTEKTEANSSEDDKNDDTEASSNETTNSEK